MEAPVHKYFLRTPELQPRKNFEEYAPQCLPAVVQAGPQASKEISGYP